MHLQGSILHDMKDFFGALCRLPPTQLERIELKPATAVQVVVLGDFNPSSFTAINSGVSTLQVKGLKSDSVNLQNTGCCFSLHLAQTCSFDVLEDGCGLGTVH